jgi:hypothetical protein
MLTAMVENNIGKRLHNRLAVKLLRGLGAFTDPGVVARSTLELIAAGEPRRDFAIWSKRAGRFEWAARPSWSADASLSDELLKASEGALRRVLSPSAPGSPELC